MSQPATAMIERSHFVCNGLDFYREKTGSVLAVFDCNHEVIACATAHSMFEDVTFEYYDHEQEVIGEGSNADIYHYSDETLARWLVCTHPFNG